MAMDPLLVLLLVVVTWLLLLVEWVESHSHWMGVADKFTVLAG